jgi:hypothetical protein
MVRSLASAGNHACSSSVRHMTRDKNKLTTRTVRANTKASKTFSLRAYFSSPFFGSSMPH